MGYFVYDHHGNGFDTFNTEEEAKKFAQECLNNYLQNDNTDSIDIYWGKIKGEVYSNDEVLEFKKQE